MSHSQLDDAERAAATQILGVLAKFDNEQIDRILSHVQQQTDARDLPMFARGIAGPLGKLDNDLKTKVDEYTHGLYIRMCAMQQADASSDLRNYVYLRVHSKTYDAMVMERVNHDADRMKALAQLIGPFGAPEFGAVSHG